MWNHRQIMLIRDAGRLVNNPLGHVHCSGLCLSVVYRPFQWPVCAPWWCFFVHMMLGIIQQGSLYMQYFWQVSFSFYLLCYACSQYQIHKVREVFYYLARKKDKHDDDDKMYWPGYLFHKSKDGEYLKRSLRAKFCRKVESARKFMEEWATSMQDNIIHAINGFLGKPVYQYNNIILYYLTI